MLLRRTCSLSTRNHLTSRSFSPNGKAGITHEADKYAGKRNNADKSNAGKWSNTDSRDKRPMSPKEKEAIEAGKAFVNIIEPLEGITRRLIQASATREAGHEHRDVVRLWSTIPQASGSADVPSLEKSQFLGDETHSSAFDPDPLQADGIYDDLQPGTFVEIRRNRVITYGVILQLRIIEARRHALTLIYTGEMWPHLMTDITHTIPNFINQDLLYRSGTEYTAADTSETVARLKIVDQIRVFSRQHEKQFNGMGKELTRLYDIVRHTDPERWTDVTTSEATRHMDVRKPPPILTMFAVHSQLMSRSLYFIADPRNHKSTHRFSVRPLSHVQTILQVDDWVRTNNLVYISFLSKARLIIQEARRIRTSSGDGPPTLAETSFEPWSESDMTIIRFLQHSMRTTRTIQSDPYHIALPNIVKGLGFYTDKVVSAGLTQTILCEIGVLAPWDDVVTRTPELRLNHAPPGTSKEERALNELVDYNLRSPGKLVPVSTKKKLVGVHIEGLTELHETDPYESIRHDFGNLPVYVVDDFGAQELDDGLSIEPITNEPGSYWVHVHVADPTTIIPPGHVLDLQARDIATSFYSPHRNWPMLPHSLAPMFSLGAKAKGEAQEVFTVSLKLNDVGDFLDYKIRAGIVRNVQILKYSQVDQALGFDHSCRTYPLAGTRVPDVHFAPIEIHHADLQKLRELANTMSIRSFKENPILGFAFPTAGVDFGKGLPASPPQSEASVPTLWKGFPPMTYYVERLVDIDKTFRRIVAEYMKLAGRASSRFCVERGLPAIRRASAPLHTPLEKDMAEILALRGPTGHVDPIECLKRNLYAPPGEPSLEPLEHWSLAIPKGEGYSRVTSPMRRYADLIMHWQIKHELLPVSKRTSSQPLFPAEYLRPVMHRIFDKERAVMNATSLYQRHWALACLVRYIESCRAKNGPDFNCFPGLEAQTTNLVGFDTRNVTGQIPVILNNLGVQGLLRGVDHNASIPIGTTFKVKITEITLGLEPLMILGTA